MEFYPVVVSLIEPLKSWLLGHVKFDGMVGIGPVVHVAHLKASTPPIPSMVEDHKFHQPNFYSSVSLDAPKIIRTLDLWKKKKIMSLDKVPISN